MHYTVKCVKIRKDLHDTQEGTKFVRPRTRALSCISDRDLISTHAIDTRSVMLDETCNATAALSALLYALNTSSQNATKCYQQEGHSPVFEHAFRKTLDLFFPPESLLASLVKNAWFPARMAGIYGKTAGCCKEEFTAHQQKTTRKCERALAKKPIASGTLYREIQAVWLRRKQESPNSTDS